MNKILLALSLLIPMSSFAQDKVYYHQAFCQKNENGRESRISNITKISEDDQMVTFGLILNHARCQNIDRLQYPIKFQKKMIQITHYGLSYPFKKIHLQLSDYRAITDTAVEVEITLDKAALKNKSSRRYILDFWPENWVGFPWIMQFTDNDGEVEVTFEGFERL